jgi:predicted PurR-regulated permease PerM
MELLPETIQDAIHELDYNKLITGVMNFLTNGSTPTDTTFAAVAGKNLTGILGSFTSIFMTALLGFIFSIYALTGKEKLKGQFTRLAEAYLGDAWQNRALPVLDVANECFHSYIVGQVVEAIIIGVLCTAGMWVLRLPYAAMVGTVVGFTALIPVFGCYLGAAVGALMCLAVSPMKALIFLVFICVLQQLEGNLIYPRVVGTSLGLPGIWVLAAVTVGGGIGGIAGMLFSVPLAATIYRLISIDVRDRETTGGRRTTAADVIDRINEEKNGEER